MRIFKTLDQRVVEEFLTLEKEAIDDLKDIDLEYSLLLDEIEVLTKKYPFLEMYLGGSYAGTLSEEERNTLKEYLNKLRWKDIRERQHFYFLGHRDAVSYFKKIDII